MHVCTLLFFANELWARDFSAAEDVTGISLSCLGAIREDFGIAPKISKICLRVSSRCSLLDAYSLVLAAIRALHTTCEAMTAVKHSKNDSGTPLFLIASDAPQVATVVSSILDTLQGTMRWSWLHLDHVESAGELAGTSSLAALELLSQSLLRPAGRAYSLSRALLDMEAETLMPSHTGRLLAISTAFEERLQRGTPGNARDFAYAVNGDNWHAPGEHGLYPQQQLKNEVEETLGKIDGVHPRHILAVGGGIAAAFDLVCQAFGLQGGHALVVGAAYAGIEHILLLRNIEMKQIFLQDSVDAIVSSLNCRHDTRVVLLTHPSLYVAHDLSELVGRVIAKTGQTCLTVIDECYVDYHTSSTHLRSDHFFSRDDAPTKQNLVVGLRGLSKLHGLAALRLAYTVSCTHVRHRLALALSFKSISTPVLLAAKLRLKSFNKKQALRRESAFKRRIFDSLRKHPSLQACGKGPYVVLHLLKKELFSAAVAALEKRHIYINASTFPLVIYQPTGLLADKLFCECLDQLVGAYVASSSDFSASLSMSEAENGTASSRLEEFTLTGGE